jgi:hypothetical protein
MNLFCAHQADRKTDSHAPMVACQAQQVRQESSVDVVGADRQLPHMGDDEAFAARLQKAWQKMLDDEESA